LRLFRNSADRRYTIPVFYNIAPILAGRFSLFLYYVRSVSFAFLFFLRPALQIFSGSFGLMKLLLRGNVVSYGGTLIILNRSTSTSRLNERSRARLSSRKERKREREREKENEREKQNRAKRCSKKKTSLSFECLADCTMPVLIDVYFVLRATSGCFAAKLIKSNRYNVAGIINDELTTVAAYGGIRWNGKFLIIILNWAVLINERTLTRCN